MMPPDPAPRRWRWTALAGASAIGAVGLAASAPYWSAALPGCTFHELTGWHCPGCGGTRGTMALLAGDLPRAWRMNPLLVALAAMAVTLGVRAVWRERRGVIPAFPPLANAWGWGIGIAVLVFAAVRNLPWWPFTLLAPP